MNAQHMKAVPGRKSDVKDAEWIAKLPPADAGCLFLNAQGKPVCPNPDSPEFSKLTRHFGSVKGAWPRIVDS